MGAGSLASPPLTDERCHRLLVEARRTNRTALVAPWAAGWDATHAVVTFACGLADLMEQDAQGPEAAQMTAAEALRVYARQLREETEAVL